MHVQIQDTNMQIRERIAERVGPQRFKVWFKNSTRLTCTEGFVEVGVPNVFIGGWIENHFTDTIAEAARDALSFLSASRSRTSISAPAAATPSPDSSRFTLR